MPGHARAREGCSQGTGRVQPGHGQSTQQPGRSLGALWSPAAEEGAGECLKSRFSCSVCNIVIPSSSPQVHQMDERVLEVSSSGTVIKPDAWMVVKGEGMPIHGRPFEHGNLYIHFTGEEGGPGRARGLDLAAVTFKGARVVRLL